MLQYLIVLLDDTCTSFCHYSNTEIERKLISLDNLKAGIFYAMKENLMIQFVFPDYELPKEYKETIESIDHNKIVSSLCDDMAIKQNADVVIFNNWIELESYRISSNQAYVLRTCKSDFFDNFRTINSVMKQIFRLNIVFIDIEAFTDDDFEEYKKALLLLSENIKQLYVDRFSPQLNLLTDRILLDKMNNCNAGYKSITLAPDGKFYICPAFYNADDDFGLGNAKFNVGSLVDGVDIKNSQLYKPSHAPICRVCDAYQCKRCIWLNRKTTYEINTPSHEQCVVAHIERNASEYLLNEIREHGTFMPKQEIKEISYLDPFDVIKDF